MSHDLRSAAGACAVPWMAVTVRGAEAASYLQGQLSQDLDVVGVGDTTWTFLLQPTGKVDTWLRLTRTADDAYLLDAPCADAGPVVARLERFRLRTPVEVEAVECCTVSLRGPGTSSAAEPATEGVLVLPAGWPGVEGVDLVALASADPPQPDVTTVDLAAWDALRVECGVPLNGPDLGPDTIPAEAGQWVIDASVSFTKGCFTGQELVARIDSRGGNVPRPLRGLVLEGGEPGALVAGAEVVLGDRVVGHLSSAASSPALGPIAMGPVNRAAEAGSAVEIRSGAALATATLRTLPLR